MAVPAALSALGSALTTNVFGITEKATLTIVTGSDSDASGAAGSAAGSVAGAAAGAAGAAAGAAGAAATALGVGTAAASAAVPKTYRMTVQFNPSSISFHASTVDSPFQYLQQKSDSEIPLQGFRPPSISMSVMLIFDQVNVKDCFMMEKFKVSTQDIAQLAVNKGVNTTVYSVQKQTNAFVGMMLSDETRTVTFQWADLCFKGEVTEVRADYTMFSISGRPVRSQVRLNLSQRLDKKTDYNDWNKAFEACFPESSGEFGGKSVTEQITNLVNINL